MLVLFLPLPLALSPSALHSPNVPILGHLPLAAAESFCRTVALASAAVRCLFPLVEREDLIQVAREALVRSSPRCIVVEPSEPYLRRCIAGALQHHLQDRVRLVRISRRAYEKGTRPLGHTSIDAPAAGEISLHARLSNRRRAPCRSSCRRPRPQPCGSPSSRGCPCGPPRRCCRSARWLCSGLRRGPRLLAPAAGGGGLRPPRDSCQARGKSQRTRHPLAP